MQTDEFEWDYDKAVRNFAGHAAEPVATAAALVDGVREDKN